MITATRYFGWSTSLLLDVAVAHANHIVVILDFPNLLVSYKTISENKKQLAFHVS